MQTRKSDIERRVPRANHSIDLQENKDKKKGTFPEDDIGVLFE
jgi:hypothetical protein